MTVMSSQQAARQQVMRLLARASESALVQIWQDLDAKPAYRFLKEPEVAAIMIEGRAGGTGGAFNLGEATVTRCIVELEESGIKGFAYALGRNKKHSEVSAILEAVFQTEKGQSLRDSFVATHSHAERERAEAKLQQAAATRVDFFTLVRGD